ncbi:MAG: hypothetical protein KJ587_03110 [Alphaproteobacteria bacterium]|nr:hypothetical protein [Alphaproteobacteria bacterium]
MDNLLDPRFLGEAALIMIGAIVLGFIVSRFWPKAANPKLFGALATFAVVAGLSYLGNAAAGLALVVLIVMAILLVILGFAF